MPDRPLDARWAAVLLAVLLIVALFIWPPARVAAHHLDADARCALYARVALEEGWTLGAVATLREVMFAESKCRPGTVQCAANTDPAGSCDHGLLQLNDHWHGHLVAGEPARWHDARRNLRDGHRIWAERGWTPWAVCRRGIVDCVTLPTEGWAVPLS